jgi:hypothetical protein
MKKSHKISLLIVLLITILFASGLLTINITGYIAVCDNKDDLSKEEAEMISNASNILIDQIKSHESGKIYDRFIEMAKAKTSIESLDESFRKIDEYAGKIIGESEKLHIFKIYSKPEIQVLCQEKEDGRIVDYKIGPLEGFNNYIVTMQKLMTEKNKEFSIEAYFINEGNDLKIHTFNMNVTP